jgi:UDP-GlcNAc:undecaprenyl-phosphate/decaprenyl-phosphate GlcNAc-1-phosphate transferase
MDYAIPTQFFTSLTELITNWINNPTLSKYLAFVPIVLIAFIVTFLLTPVIGKIAWSIGATYKPGVKRKGKIFDNPAKAIHHVETPNLGGLAVILPAFIIALLSFKLNAFTIPVLLALAVLLIGSTLDDIYNLNAKIQFGYQILAALIVVVSIIDLSQVGIIDKEILNLSAYSLQFNLFDFPFSIVFPGDLFLFVWLLLCLNAVKWVGGSPGLLETYSGVIFALIFVIGIRTVSNFTSTMSIAMASSLLAFLFYAIPPEKIMSGSSGKSIYGFMIALLALMNDSKISTSLMLLGLPILDAVYVVIRRIIKYKPKSFKELLKINDTSHFHHKLIELNLSRIQILLIESSIALFFGSIAIATTGAMRYFGVIFGISLILLIIVIVNKQADKTRKEKEEKTPESKYSY